MTIQQVQYILQIYHTGSISKAASYLFVSQSNLSNSLRSLEQELGFPIFIRSNQGIRPTEQGLLVLEQAGRMWECYEAMRHVNTAEHAVRFRLGGAPYTPVLEAYSKLCIEYQHYSRLEFSCLNMDFSTLVEKLYLSLLDMGVVALIPSELPKAQRELAAKHLDICSIARIPMVLRIGPLHPLYRKADLKLSDFAEYPFVDYQDHPFWNYGVVRAGISLENARDRIIIMPDRSSKSEILRQSHMYSIGCQLPHHLNQRYAFRNIPLGDLTYELVSVTSNRKPMTTEMQRYLELLHEELSTL